MERLERFYKIDMRERFNAPRELVMEVLKFGADVEVLAPPALRKRVAEGLRQAAGRYG